MVSVFELVEVMKVLNLKFTFLSPHQLSFIVVFVIPRWGGGLLLFIWKGLAIFEKILTKGMESKSIENFLDIRNVWSLSVFLKVRNISEIIKLQNKTQHVIFCSQNTSVAETVGARAVMKGYSLGGVSQHFANKDGHC